MNICTWTFTCTGSKKAVLLGTQASCKEISFKNPFKQQTLVMSTKVNFVQLETNHMSKNNVFLNSLQV